MSERRSALCQDRLATLFEHHPYLALLQKEDWQDYLLLLVELYELLESEALRMPYEAIRSVVIKFYSAKPLASIEGKIQHVFTLFIGELRVLQDSHDHLGNRFIETTKAGQSLLQLTETLLSQRTRYSGTGAETLLGSLNEILTSRQQITTDDAIAHHKEKIKAYQKDIERIRQKGPEHAELLPIPHSNEALFSQAEEAAFHILAAIEDVKTAIEQQRQNVAIRYFDGHLSAGQSLNAVAEFYEALFATNEYRSYMQAKRLLSHLEGFAARFINKNVDLLLHKIRQAQLISENDLNRSQLRNFAAQFTRADHAIQEKVRSQIRLLQQQVHYAIHTDVQGLQSLLVSTLSKMINHRVETINCFQNHPIELTMPPEFECWQLEPFSFIVPTPNQTEFLHNENVNEEERRALLLALLQAEEATVQGILERLHKHLSEGKPVLLDLYPFEKGLAEYYVLSEIEIFDRSIERQKVGLSDLLIPTKHGSFYLHQAPIYQFQKRCDYGSQPTDTH